MLISSLTPQTLETRPSLISSRTFPPPHLPPPSSHLPRPPPSFHRSPAFALLHSCLRWLAASHDVCALTRFCCSTSGMRSDWALAWRSAPQPSFFSHELGCGFCFLFSHSFFFLFCPSSLTVFHCSVSPEGFVVFSSFLILSNGCLLSIHVLFSHHTWLSSSFVPHGYFQPCSLGFLSSFFFSSSSSDVPHFQTISLSSLSCWVKSLATML